MKVKSDKMPASVEAANNSGAPEVTPLALLPVYLALVATSRRNCVSIPSNQQVVVDACAKLSESVTKFREFLEPFATILIHSLIGSFPLVNPTPPVTLI